MTERQRRTKSAPLTADELSSLPVFPLPRVVFFPGTLLPLHLFEARYRAMIEHCIAHGPKAMAVTLLKPGFEASYEGRPAFHPVAGVGRIVTHERNPNGTYDVVLEGVDRVFLEERTDHDHPFRLAKATVLGPTGTDVPREEVLALMACASQVAAVVRQRHPELELGVSVEDRPAVIADTLADRFVAAPDRRQEILEARDVRRRVALVMDAIGELLALLATHDAPS
ncbi:MAG: LON peptidase substrate-binding domain-containing protein [Myxococcales bacterium]|nr:LON peptidase substrate-binding domain-containing protein [Myxococcales bacterium]